MESKSSKGAADRNNAYLGKASKGKDSKGMKSSFEFYDSKGFSYGKKDGSWKGKGKELYSGAFASKGK